MGTVTPESKVKNKIKTILKKHGAYYTMPMGTGFGQNGTPDFLICVAGQFLAVEAKAGKGKATPLQQIQLQAIRDAGGTAMIINETNLDVLDAWLALLTGITPTNKTEGK